MTADAIVIDMFYTQSVERVWDALTSSEALADWLMPNDFEPRIGHRFTFRTTPQQAFDGIVHCEVVALDPLHRIAYSWHSGPLHTLVTFTVEPAEGGTHLRLEHTGFAAGGKAGLTIRDLMASGWNSTILRERLPALLNRQATILKSPSNDDKEMKS